MTQAVRRRARRRRRLRGYCLEWAPVSDSQSRYGRFATRPPFKRVGCYSTVDEALDHMSDDASRSYRVVRGLLRSKRIRRRRRR